MARRRELHQLSTVVLGECLMPEADAQDRLYSRFGTDEGLHTGELAWHAWPRGEDDSIVLREGQKVEFTLGDDLEGKLGYRAQELHDIVDEGVAMIDD